MWSLRHLKYRWDDRRNSDTGRTPNPTKESNLTPVIAPVTTRKGKRRMLHHPPTPQESRQTPPTAPSGEMPPPPPVTPTPRTRTRKQKDQGTSDPMFSTQEINAPREVALSQGEHRGPYPTMAQRVGGLLRQPQELRKRQREDSHLFRKIGDLDKGGSGGDYVTDDDGLLWYAPPGSILRLVIPRSLVPGILALVHTTYGHPGVARTTELTQRKYHWTSLKGDIRNYVLSWLKRSTSQRVAMLPARFLKTWEVLEIDIHDMGARSVAGNKYLLVIVDRASKFLFACPLANKTAKNVAKKLLELLLTFGISLSLRSDPGTEFTAEVVQHFCKWLNVTIDYGPTDHPRAQGAVERLGGWIQETLAEPCKTWPRRWDEYVQPALWLHRTTPDPRLPCKATPFLFLFGRDCRTQMDATFPSPDGEGTDGLHNLIEDKSESLRQVREVRRDLQHRHEQRRLRREHQNAGIRCTSTGTRLKQGDLVLAKKADSALHNDCVHVKLTHERWTGPWTVTAVITPGLCYRVTLQGR